MFSSLVTPRLLVGCGVTEEGPGGEVEVEEGVQK
jgi:hypothetical protein